MRPGYPIAALASFFCISTLVHAQTFEQISALRLVEPSPSIRSAAMGGAADSAGADAGAVAANPAAVARLKRISISTTATNTSYATESVRGGGNFFYAFHDRLSSSALSQFVVAVPLGGAVFSGYFNEQPRLYSDMPVVAGTLARGPYEAPQCEGPCGYLFAPEPGFDRRDRRYGASVAWRIGQLDIGAGGELRQLDERSATGRAIFLTTGGATSDRLFRTTSGTSFIPNAGLVWHAGPRVALGASFKGGGTFDRTTAACATDKASMPFCQSDTAQLHRTREQLPSALRAGLSVQATRGLTVAAAVVRRDYSRLARERYGIMDDTVIMPYRDVTETHAGAEYSLGRWPVSLRAGWWRDPSRFTSRLYALSDWARSIDHRTFGLGVNLSGTELALAVDDGGSHGTRSASIGFSHTF